MLLCTTDAFYNRIRNGSSEQVCAETSCMTMLFVKELCVTMLSVKKLRVTKLCVKELRVAINVVCE